MAVRVCATVKEHDGFIFVNPIRQGARIKTVDMRFTVNLALEGYRSKCAMAEA